MSISPMVRPHVKPKQTRSCIHQFNPLNTCPKLRTSLTMAPSWWQLTSMQECKNLVISSLTMTVNAITCINRTLSMSSRLESSFHKMKSTQYIQSRVTMKRSKFCIHSRVMNSNRKISSSNHIEKKHSDNLEKLGKNKRNPLIMWLI